MSSALDVCLGCGLPEGSLHAPYCPYNNGAEAESVEAIPPIRIDPVRPSWDDYFFSLARLVSSRATCPRASIGCVIAIDLTHQVVATGYNGAPAGESHCSDPRVGCTLLADHCIRSIHAEVNAARSVRETILTPELLAVGVPELVAYVVGPRAPCSHCARELYQSGVREVKWRES